MTDARVLAAAPAVILHLSLASAQTAVPSRVSLQEETYPLYPVLLEVQPEIPSPCLTDQGTEVLIGVTEDGRFTLLPVTVENGSPRDRRQGLHGKGKQTDVDVSDFPTLGSIGLHSISELDQTKSITGRSAVEITIDGRPEGSSWSGFLAHEEDIVSVLKADNLIVTRLSLTHPELARTLFHIWNTKFLSDLADIEHVLYNGKKVFFRIEGGRGWQTSIFEDEIWGSDQIFVWREMEAAERSLLQARHSQLTAEELRVLEEKLTRVHTGEMVAFYAMRYGFYEGHTDFRADPISLSWIFGFRSLVELEQLFGSELYPLLTSPHQGKGN